MHSDIYILSYTINHGWPIIYINKNKSMMKYELECFQKAAWSEQKCFNFVVTHICNGEVVTSDLDYFN